MGLREWLARRDQARQSKIKSASLQARLDAQAIDKELKEARQQKKLETQIARGREELRRLRPSGTQRIVARARGFATGLKNKLNEGRKEGHFRGIDFGGNSKSSSPFSSGMGKSPFAMGGKSTFNYGQKEVVKKKKPQRQIIIKL